MGGTICMLGWGRRLSSENSAHPGTGLAAGERQCAQRERIAPRKSVRFLCGWPCGNIGGTREVRPVPIKSCGRFLLQWRCTLNLAKSVSWIIGEDEKVELPS